MTDEIPFEVSQGYSRCKVKRKYRVGRNDPLDTEV